MPRKPPEKPKRRRTPQGLSGQSRRRVSRLPPRLHLVRRQFTLVYGVRLLPQVLEESEHEQVPLPQAGAGETLTLHQITGDIAEIRAKLEESMDAFFEFFGESRD